MEPDTFIDFGNLVPEILAVCSVLVTAFIGWGAKKFKDLTNISIEASHREALHKAINTGFQLVLEKFPDRINVKSELVASVGEWVIKSVPDALEWFKLTSASSPTGGVALDPILKELIESKIPIHTELPPA